MLYRDPTDIKIMQQQEQSQGSQSQSQSQPSYSQQSDASFNINSRRYAHPRGHLHRMPYPPSYHRLLTPPNEEYATISQSSTGSMMESQRSMGSTSSRRSMMSSIPTLRRQDATVGQG
ncbi:hypothetical protein SMACR_09014 [Sordaria macrospora]|uniref:WGS project CABT00000000 data, contig 2.31 n=2 Tax=Sordaria macrospora TaxID=5147 RepID=F7W5N1_SORMK|nr:uncharacterized protein SMAC_09014 [Sordaria macrospora k-hell]KAA8635495.1 hypothetical protein SMACR_09014 [Sordaria macrospora]KAH7629549.1 hypothetical protein B0T09DRAFT_158437 [Sordaria sp. MPI-SDFR-AT-0083]WPJ66237.1 hypothetical protein SMAC4_09014 [Sordaria macrospora]CCC12819.1 unnamed protein product [Sordaria macrospora k-hell]